MNLVSTFNDQKYKNVHAFVNNWGKQEKIIRKTEILTLSSFTKFISITIIYCSTIFFGYHTHKQITSFIYEYNHFFKYQHDDIRGTK